MDVIIAIIIAFLVGGILGIIFGVNTASTKRVIESTGTRHTKEFYKAMHKLDMRLSAMPEELVEAVREAFPQLYDGPEKQQFDGEWEWTKRKGTGTK